MRQRDDIGDLSIQDQIVMSCQQPQSAGSKAQERGVPPSFNQGGEGRCLAGIKMIPKIEKPDQE
jgi:hypothetical protein